jgi:hypothetical protein
MYSDCVDLMPSDLIAIKEEQYQPEHINDTARKLFKDKSIHLMPLTRNAFYTLQDRVDAVDTPRSNNQDDFYKGAIQAAEEVKEPPPEAEAISITVQGLTP